MSCQLLMDPPGEGAWNMAVDEALLERTVEHGAAALRFYQWREPTLSLGYFQAYAERASHRESASAAVVRRLSGGGALVHDRELTYSLCLPATHALARQQALVYRRVHRSLVEALGDLGLEARRFGDDSAAEAGGGTEPFLCFARRTDDDIVMTPRAGAQSSENTQRTPAPAKVAGSAQRRSRGALLQHGAVILSRSEHATELAGIRELTGVDLGAEALVGSWIRRLGDAVGLELSAAETSQSAGLTGLPRLVEKYSQPIWTKRR